MFRRLILALALAALLMVSSPLVPSSVRAQDDDACPALVTEALAELDSNCTDVGRNQVCYGHNQVSAAFWGDVESEVFDEPTDIVDAVAVQALTGAPLQLEDQLWGLALMQLQADIPDTLPGQNVTFILVGDVEVENTVAPDQIREPVTPVDVTATTGVNLRSGPGTNYNVLSSIASGETLPVIGMNGAGDWVQVVLPDGQRAWASAQLVRADGDLATLPVLTGAPLYGPMEAFYLRTGLGATECADAPPDHLLVHSPEGLAVAFTANGVHFTLSSTAALRRPADDNMIITTFDGQAVLGVEVPAGDFAITVPAGLEVDVPLGVDDQGRTVPVGAPQNFRPLNPDEWVGYMGVSENIQVVQGFTVPEPPPLPTIEEITQALSGGGPTTAPSGVPLGSGDVQVTLLWDNLADMDLHVTEPGGTRIFFGNRASPSGGTLDLDSNFPCGFNTNFAENVFWPIGQAPSGTYQVDVVQYSTCGAGDAHWTLIVQVGGQVVMTQSGVGGRATFTFTK